jgi:catechol 2,3-dioxygenase-like lactoylglutathione lyase family enzyme
MNPHVSVITLGVKDFNSAKAFYRDGLGWPIQQENYSWVCFSLGDDSSALALYPWDALADDANVPADGTGFRGSRSPTTFGQKSVSMNFSPRRSGRAGRSSSTRNAPRGAATAATSRIPRATSGKLRPARPVSHSPNSCPQSSPSWKCQMMEEGLPRQAALLAAGDQRCSAQMFAGAPANVIRIRAPVD